MTMIGGNMLTIALLLCNFFLLLFNLWSSATYVKEIVNCVWKIPSNAFRLVVHKLIEKEISFL